MFNNLNNFYRTFLILNAISIALFTGASTWANTCTAIASGVITVGFLKDYFEQNPKGGPLKWLTCMVLGTFSLVFLFSITSWIDQTLGEEILRTSPKVVLSSIVQHSTVLYFWIPNFVMDFFDGNFASAFRVGSGSPARTVGVLFTLLFVLMSFAQGVKAIRLKRDES
ncbi:MAG: hypothetical protein IH845_00710 [Nanoarchaeota archaeon]|nr:hypothetical protein [Nanoarchaeota archaeon]